MRACSALLLVFAAADNPIGNDVAHPPIRLAGGSIADCLRENEEVAKNTTGYSLFTTNQHFELDFHLRNEWRKSEDFEIQSAMLFRSWGLGQRDFEGQVVVDIGAGSRLRTKFFIGARLVVVEPLAAQLLQHAQQLPHIDIDDRSRVWQLYSMPAEFRACGAEGLASLVVVLNVLDHVWQPDLVLRSAERLLRPCSIGPSLIVVSLDIRYQPALGHPHVLTRRWFHEQAHANHSRLRLVRAYQQQLVSYGKMQFSWDGGTSEARDNSAWTFMFRRRCGLEIDSAIPKPQVNMNL